MADEDPELPDDVELPLGWKLTFDIRDNGEEKSVQGFVHGPGRASASLCFALANGTTSDDNEIDIPEEVLMELENYKEYE